MSAWMPSLLILFSASLENIMRTCNREFTVPAKFPVTRGYTVKSMHLAPDSA
jgi:hypothetical protein